MNAKELNMAKELKRREYTVTATLGEGLLVEKETFWGYYQYDTDIGRTNTKFKWVKSLILALFWGIGIIGGLYWLYQKDKMNKEITALVMK